MKSSKTKSVITPSSKESIGCPKICNHTSWSKWEYVESGSVSTYNAIYHKDYISGVYTIQKRYCLICGAIEMQKIIV